MAKKNGRKKYLDDFQLSASGEYIYSGRVYRYEGSERQLKAQIKKLWLYAAAETGLHIVCGCLPVPAMLNSFYVILPYTAAFVMQAAVLWAIFRLCEGRKEMREYIYKASVEPLTGRSFLAMLFCLMTAAGQIIYFTLHEFAGNDVFSFIMLALQLLEAYLAFLVKRENERIKYIK